MAVSNQYTADSIESLSPLAFTRLRPGVYCGSTEYSTQLIIELFSNALDEHNLGHGDVIEISVSKDNVIMVKDNGQGFLVNEQRDDGKTVLEAAFSVLNTSGKYRDDGVYEGTSLGLNGIGAKLPTFLSHWLNVITIRDGRTEEINFKEGVFENRVLGTSNEPNGTKVTFQPSEEFFKHAEPDVKYLEKMLNDICGLCPNLTVIFNNKKINHPEGIEYLVKDRAGKDIPVTLPLIFQEKNDKYKLDCGIQYTTANSSNMVSYVNYGLTDAGPHITAIKSCITRSLNKWAKEQGILKEKDKNLEGSALQEGLVLAFNLVAPGISYDAQTKSRIVSNEFVPFLNDVFGKQLEVWLDNNPEYGKTIIEKALLARKAAEAAKKAREAVRAKAEDNKKEKVFRLPTTLADCWSKERLDCELLIAEGKSAASGLVAARDSEFQAVYGVRGKMLSVLKSTPAAIMKNQEINNLVQALGLEVNPLTAKMTYDKSKLRYGKIIACADADPDGKLIENLLFNALWYMCPDLIIEGHVYSAVPPLFRITTKKNEYIYCKDEAELEAKKAQLGSQVLAIGRNKGLGEQDSEELSYCLLEPVTRNVIQLTVEDIGATDIMFKKLYGKAVEPRLRFLNEHLEEANVD